MRNILKKDFLVYFYLYHSLIYFNKIRLNHIIITMFETLNYNQLIKTIQLFCDNNFSGISYTRMKNVPTIQMNLAKMH